MYEDGRLIPWADGPMLGHPPHEMSDYEWEDQMVYVRSDLPDGRYIHEYEVAFSMLTGRTRVLLHNSSVRIGNRMLKQ
jgi:hypothetical protein